MSTDETNETKIVSAETKIVSDNLDLILNNTSETIGMSAVLDLQAQIAQNKKLREIIALLKPSPEKLSRSKSHDNLSVKASDEASSDGSLRSQSVDDLRTNRDDILVKVASAVIGVVNGEIAQTKADTTTTMTVTEDETSTTMTIYAHNAENSVITHMMLENKEVDGLSSEILQQLRKLIVAEGLRHLDQTRSDIEQLNYFLVRVDDITTAVWILSGNILWCVAAQGSNLIWTRVVETWGPKLRRVGGHMVQSAIDDAKFVGGGGLQLFRRACIAIYVTGKYSGPIVANSVWSVIVGGVGAVVGAAKKILSSSPPPPDIVIVTWGKSDSDSDSYSGDSGDSGDSGGSGADSGDSGDSGDSDGSGGDSGGSGGDDGVVIGETLTIEEQLDRNYNDAIEDGSVIKIDDDDGDNDGEQKEETKETKTREQKGKTKETKTRRKKTPKEIAAEKKRKLKRLARMLEMDVNTAGVSGYDFNDENSGRLYEPSYRQFTL